MVLEYVEGKMVCDNGLGEATSRNYLRDIISGVMYLHSHVRFKFPSLKDLLNCGERHAIYQNLQPINTNCIWIKLFMVP
jgi:hypothetical protein